MKNTTKRVKAATLAVGVLASNLAMGGAVYAEPGTGTARNGANIGFNKTSDEVYYRGAADNTAENIVNNNKSYFQSAVNTYRTTTFQSTYNTDKAAFDAAEQAAYDADNTYVIKDYPEFDTLYTITNYDDLFLNTGTYKYAMLNQNWMSGEYEITTTAGAPRMIDGNLYTIQNVTFNYTSYTVQDAQIIDTVSLTVTPPTAGTVIGTAQRHNDQYNYDYDAQDPEPTISLGDESKYGFEVKAYIKNDHTDEWFEGTIEEGASYFLEIALMPKVGYNFVDTADEINLTVNGVEEFNVINRGINSILMVARVKGVAGTAGGMGGSSEAAGATAATAGTPNTGVAPVFAKEGNVADDSLAMTIAAITIAMGGAYMVARRINESEA